VSQELSSNPPRESSDSSQPANEPPFHAVPASEALERLGGDGVKGLTEHEVIERRERSGFNELKSAPRTPWVLRFLSQFRELVVGILIVAAIIAGIAGDWPDTLAILAIVLLNGVIGFFQEEKAERALSALQALSAPMAKVVRGGAVQSVPARDLVPGDRISLEAGVNIPADARLMEAFSLHVQESSLTGESLPAEKEADCTLPPETSLGDRRNMLYMSTVATTGKAEAVVTAIGMQTELGRIAGMLQHSSPEQTPLQRRLGELGRVLVIVCLAIVAVISALELYRGGKIIDVLIRSISLAVAAVPEGLPAVVTLALALGLQRMVARNVLIRKLPSVETLGSVTVVCSDKTGTLTRNEMTVRELSIGGTSIRVTGAGYAPAGTFLLVDDGAASESSGEEIDPRSVPDIERALTIGVQCNNAKIVKKEGSDAWQAIGDPTEAALIVVGKKAGIEPRPAEQRALFELPFDSDRKAMSVVLSAESGAIMYTKGAPERLLDACHFEQRDGDVVPLTNERRQEIAESSSRLAAQALRVLALAYREFPHTDREKFTETEMVFSALAGMIDPPREEVKGAVERCRAAGVRPVMITGDHPETAGAIARELGIVGEGDQTRTGADLDGLSDEKLAEEVEQIAVYARVSPEHKLRVVRAWRSRKAVVAMTGDGVNDAPAVKAADIGIAMGITGTDVTKEASDMVLADDNFTSIVGAVEEGRGIFDNIQKFIHYLLSCNAGEVMLMFFAALIGWPAPLEAIQILWINLVTDGLPALALAMEPPEKGIMERPPRPPHEPVITRARGLLIALHGLLIAAAATIGFAIVYYGPGEGSLERGRTVAFCIMSYSQLFFAIGCRSHTRTLPQLGFFTNPHLLGAILISGALQTGVVLFPFAQSIFDTVTLAPREWLIVGLALAPISVIEVVKLIRTRFARPEQAG